MAQILHGLQMPHSEKPHVFPEATYDVAVRNTCGFSQAILISIKYQENHLESLADLRSNCGTYREAGLENIVDIDFSEDDSK